jgi:hypothetical protein
MAFALKESLATRANASEAAVVAGGNHVSAPYEARTAGRSVQGRFRVVITGPQGLERTATFAIDDDPAAIAERVRETLED